MVMVNWVPLVILVVTILVDKILQNGLVRFFLGVPQSSGGLFVAISNHFQHISCCPNFPAAPLSPSFKERENKGSS